MSQAPPNVNQELLGSLKNAELKQRLQALHLPTSGQKLDLVKRICLASLPLEELRALCRERNIQVDGRGRQVRTARDMVCCLEKYPRVIDVDKHFGGPEPPRESENWIPAYRPTEHLSYNTGQEYLLSGLADGDSAETESNNSSTYERVLAWLISKPILKCLQCRKFMPPKPEKNIVGHLEEAHGLQEAQGGTADESVAMLFKVSTLVNIMTLYVWVRPTATFRQLASLIFSHWFPACQRCRHEFMVFAAPAKINVSSSETLFCPDPTQNKFFRCPLDEPLYCHATNVIQRRPIRVTYDAGMDPHVSQLQFVKYVHIPVGHDAEDRTPVGGVIVENVLPEIPCGLCGRTATLTVATTSPSGICQASRQDFFCGKKCALKRGVRARLVKLHNSPRCSTCRCAQFVYPAPRGRTSWGAAQIEEDTTAVSEIDEILLVPDVVDEVDEQMLQTESIPDNENEQDELEPDTIAQNLESLSLFPAAARSPETDEQDRTLTLEGDSPNSTTPKGSRGNAVPNFSKPTPIRKVISKRTSAAAAQQKPLCLETITNTNEESGGSHQQPVRKPFSSTPFPARRQRFSLFN